MLAARSLEDLALEDDVTRPDFELGERYLELSKELTRLSLLGIAGYGFLIKEIAMKGDATMPFLSVVATHSLLMVAGILCLGLAAGASLYCAQISTNCLKLQVDIIRFLKRRTNPGWTAKERIENDEELEIKRSTQRKVITIGRKSLKVAVGALILGTSLVVIDFALVLARVSIPTIKVVAPQSNRK